MFPFPVSHWAGAGGPSGPFVSGVQYVSITISGTSTSNTATISNIDTSLSFVVFLGFTSASISGNEPKYNMPRVELTNATTVTAYKDSGTSGAPGIVVHAAVVTCASVLVDTVQQGTITITGTNTSNTATISSVDTSRSAVFWLGNTCASSTQSLTGSNGVTLTNSTTVTAERVNPNASSTVGFVVVEFQDDVIESVQQFANSYSTSNTIETQTISSVSTSNAFIANGGYTSGDGTFLNTVYTQTLTDSTTVTLRRAFTGTTARKTFFTVVEFVPGVLASSVQRNTIIISTGTSNSATISTVNTSKTMLNFNNDYAGISYTYGYAAARIALTNSTTVSATRYADPSGAGTVAAFEVIEFN